MDFSGAASIAGIGATEFSKDSGRSELQLSAEATLAALQATPDLPAGCALPGGPRALPGMNA